MIDINLVIITTNHIYIGAVYIMSGLIGGSIGFGLITDYSMIFFKFQWFNSLGLIGIYLSIISA